MKAGIKFSQREGIETLKKTTAGYAEVYFNLEKKNEYTDLFSFMRETGVKFGLHFWALIKGKYAPNLAYDRDGIGDETERLIKETIDVAAANGAFYVNFHPESLRLVDISEYGYERPRVMPGAEVSEEEGFKSLAGHMANLKSYGEERGVATYVETVPYGVFNGGSDVILGMPTGRIIELGKMGFDACFDIGHAVAQYRNESDETIYNKVLADAQSIAPYTKLMHVTTNLPPHFGLETHNGILEEDFSQNVLPNKEQLVELLSVFHKANTDIVCIPEPAVKKMIANHFELKKLLGENGLL